MFSRHSYTHIHGRNNNNRWQNRTTPCINCGDGAVGRDRVSSVKSLKECWHFKHTTHIIYTQVYVVQGRRQWWKFRAGDLRYPWNDVFAGPVRSRFPLWSCSVYSPVPGTSLENAYRKQQRNTTIYIIYRGIVHYFTNSADWETSLGQRARARVIVRGKKSVFSRQWHTRACHRNCPISRHQIDFNTIFFLPIWWSSGFSEFKFVVSDTGEQVNRTRKRVLFFFFFNKRKTRLLTLIRLIIRTYHLKCCTDECTFHY